MNVNFDYKKSLGQNFLKDENVVNDIVNNSGIDENTLVIEIGPGSGVLSKKLAKKCKRLICYEIDERLKPVLNLELSCYSNIELIFGDFLEADVKKDIAKYDYEKLYLIANLPYYITTPIINKLIFDNIMLDKMIVMVQKEVASRFCALPCSRDYGSLTVFLNYHFQIKKMFDVSKESFVPRPSVDSSVVLFIRQKEKMNVLDEDVFYKLIRDSFKYKRKNLRNNLYEYDLEKIDVVLENYNLDLTVRAEQLKLDIFVAIANYLVENK